MKVLERPDTDPARVAFFMPTAEGPCRFGQYAPYLRQILDANGYQCVEILSPTSRNAYAGLGTLAKPFVRTGWRALFCADMLQKMLLIQRPYEECRGETEAVYEESLADLCNTLEQHARGAGRAASGAARRAGARPRLLPRRSAAPGPQAPPLIGIVGEIFCRLNTFSNENLVRCSGGIRRGSLALGHRGVDLVHQLRALPQTQADRPHMDRGSPGRVGAQARAEARRARADGAVPRRFRGPRGAGHLRDPGMRPPLPAARRRLRRDGPERGQGGLPGAARAPPGSSTSAPSPA